MRGYNLKRIQNRTFKTTSDKREALKKKLTGKTTDASKKRFDKSFPDHQAKKIEKRSDKTYTKRPENTGVKRPVKRVDKRFEDNTDPNKKEKVRNFIYDKAYVPMKLKQIADILDVSKKDRPELQDILDVLVRNGEISHNENGKYSPVNEETITGTFSAHPKGFGFVTAEGFDTDFFISEDYVNSAMNHDTVEIVLLPITEGKRREAKIVNIVERGTTEVVGRFEKSSRYGFVIPDDKKILKDVFIPKGQDLGASNGQKVVCTYIYYGSNEKKPEGKITEILGDKDEPGIDVLSIVRALNIPSEFSIEALNEAGKVNIPVDGTSHMERVDLRDVPMVTIDGAESKDLDDAVSIGVDGDDYLLGVHIADVSEYVKEDGFLDQDAKERCTSVYLCDRVIPMLPKSLSNGICSLNEGEDRLALSCLMRIDKNGKVKDHLICESLVNIDRRMTYDAVSSVLKGDDPYTLSEYSHFILMFQTMAKLSHIIRQRREKHGCIDFDFPEAKILLDDAGKTREIVTRERDEASLIIEDFMITANITVAKEYAKAELPFLYRSHGNPDPDKLVNLSNFMSKTGVAYRYKKDENDPKDIQKMLKKIKGLPEEPVINQFVLRAMQQAKYTVDCEGHFGLAEKYYCHFTSPIRRYPDLQIHRIIKENLRGNLNKKRVSHYISLLPDIAKKTSMYERRADEAERETDKMKKAEFMMSHKGESFEGVISGVTAFGLYVTLPNTVEGLVHISTLRDDYYTYMEDSMELIGERTRNTYKMGQKVKIVVDNADKETRLIDFVLAER